MKKSLFRCSLIFVASLVTSVAMAAVSCHDIVGTWKGQLGGLSNVVLNINDTGGNQYQDADIKYHSSGSIVEYGMLLGSCKKDADGTVSMSFHAQYGLNVNINTTLISKTALKTSVSASNLGEYDQGSGTLTKQ